MTGSLLKKWCVNRVCVDRISALIGFVLHHGACFAPAGSMITNGNGPLTRLSSGGGDSLVMSIRVTTREVTPCSRKLLAMC